MPSISDFWWEAFLRPLLVLKPGPSLWQTRSSLGFSSGEQHSGGGWQPGEWILSTSCSGGSAASTNLQFLSHLSLTPAPISSFCLTCPWCVSGDSLLWIWPQPEPPPPLRAAGSAVLAVLSVCWGRQIELTLLKLYFRPSHIPSGLFPLSTGQGFPSMLLPFTPLSPAVMLAASFVCSPLFPHSVFYQDSPSQELFSMSELSCAILAQQKRAELAQGVQGRILLLRSIWAHWMSHRFLLLRRAILSAVYFMFFPSFVLGV